MRAKTLRCFSFLMGVLFINALSAQYVDWQNYTSGNEVKCTAFDGTYVWAGTPHSGLMRVEVSTQEVVFFDNTNSGLPLINVETCSHRMCSTSQNFNRNSAMSF